MGDHTESTSNISFLGGRNNDEAAPPWQYPPDTDWYGRIGEQTKTGFKNRGSVCYRNSVLQMLAHSVNLLHWFEWYRFNHVPQFGECSNGKNSGRCKSCLLYDVLITFWVQAAGNCEVTVTAFWDRFFPDWNGGAMTGEQDAAEFWDEVYRQLAEETRTLFLPDLQRLCRLNTVSVIQCRGPNACATKTYRPDETGFLIARFPSDGDSKEPVSAREAIDQYFAESSIEGSACGQCHNPRFHSEKLVHLPYYLLVKVNRIEYVKGPNGPQIKKLMRDVTLEHRLTFSTDRFASVPEGGQRELEYELTAIVMHSGPNITTGHFYAFVRARGPVWTLASDQTLTPFPSWDKVAASPLAKRDAYIFAYRLVPRESDLLQKPKSQVPAASTVEPPPKTPLKEFPELREKRRGAAWANKRAVLEGYKAELEAIPECSSLEESGKEASQEAIDEGRAHPDDVREAIDGFKSLKSTLQNIPDVPENPENPEAVVAEYQNLKGNILDQLKAESSGDAEGRQRLTEDVINNVKEQLDRLAEESAIEKQSGSPAPKRPRDDTEDVGEGPRPKRRLGQRLEEKMRGLVDILFTPDGSDQPVLHARMKGLFRDVISEKSSKSTKGNIKDKGTGQSGSPQKPVHGLAAPAAKTSRVTRNRTKRKADKEAGGPQEPKRPRKGS